MEYKFRESEFYASYKQIRNQFRKYWPKQIILSCINYLYKPTKSESDQLCKQPWLVFLVIKWVLIDDQFYSRDKKDLNSPSLDKILQMMHDLATKVRMPSEYSHYILFFRNMAYQQFIYQFFFNKSSISRQKILFDSQNGSDFFNLKFREITGLNVNEFLELSMVLITRFFSYNEPLVSEIWFNNVRKAYSNETLKRFFNCVSIEFENLREFFLKDKRIKRRNSYEFYEQTAFLNSPLVKNGNNYICVYPKILFRTLEHYIYDTLRLWDAWKFMDKFGSRFERYVEESIKYSNLPYVNERQLESELYGEGNSVDFLINDGDSNIFLDAKAVEMSYLGKVTHVADIIKDKTKDSVLKAIKQVHDVCKRLSQTSSKNPIIKHRKENYLLVVTFKELYLGNGKIFYDSIAKEKIDEILKEYEDSTKIPLGNMYFITVEELDLFMQMIKEDKIGLAEGLRRAKENDSQASTQKFDFFHHLLSWNDNPKLPEYLNKKSEDIFQKIFKILKE